MSGRFHGTHSDQDMLALTLSRCSRNDAPTTPFPIPFHAPHYSADPPITLQPSGLTSHVQYQQWDDFPAQLSVRTLPSLVEPSSNSPVAFFGDQSTPNTSICYPGSYPIIPALPQTFPINKLCNGTIPIHIQSTLPVIEQF